MSGRGRGAGYFSLSVATNPALSLPALLFLCMYMRLLLFSLSAAVASHASPTPSCPPITSPLCALFPQAPVRAPTVGQ